MAYKTSTPNTNNSVLQNKSRYVQGGTTIQKRDKLGWWERRPIPEALDDITVIVRPDEEGRSDKIASNIYDSSALEWIVLQFNNIVDPVTELTTGTQLKLPSPRRVTLDIINRAPGGKREK